MLAHAFGHVLPAADGPLEHVAHERLHPFHVERRQPSRGGQELESAELYLEGLLVDVVAAVGDGGGVGDAAVVAVVHLTSCARLL